MNTLKFLRFRAIPTVIRFSLNVQTVDRNLFSHGGPLDAADVQYSRAGEAFANTTNVATESPAGSGCYEITLAGFEMDGATSILKVVDATGNAWQDLILHIETYGIYPNPLLATEGAEIVAADLAATMPYSKILGFLKNRFLMKTEMTIAAQTVYKADNVTPVMAPAVSYDGTTQTRTRGY